MSFRIRNNNVYLLGVFLQIQIHSGALIVKLYLGPVETYSGCRSNGGSISTFKNDLVACAQTPCLSNPLAILIIEKLSVCIDRIFKVFGVAGLDQGFNLIFFYSREHR